MFSLKFCKTRGFVPNTLFLTGFDYLGIYIFICRNLSGFLVQADCWCGSPTPGANPLPVKPFTTVSKTVPPDTLSVAYDISGRNIQTSGLRSRFGFHDIPYTLFCGTWRILSITTLCILEKRPFFVPFFDVTL